MIKEKNMIGEYMILGTTIMFTVTSLLCFLER